MKRIFSTRVCHFTLVSMLFFVVGLCKDNVPSVDFKYAFAPPHRITVALPDSSNKTLLDATPGKLEMSWSSENLIYHYKDGTTPPTKWKVQAQPLIDGHPFLKSKWERADGYLPVLRNSYQDSGGDLILEVAGGETAAMAKITLSNFINHGLTMALRCEAPSEMPGDNPAWLDNLAVGDHLLAAWQDRVVVLGIGADETPVSARKVLTMEWNLKAGEKREAWLIRPYKNGESDVAALRQKNWAGEFERSRREWIDLLDRASRVIIPDRGVSQAFYACLADLFIMREPIGKGYIAAAPERKCTGTRPMELSQALPRWHSVKWGFITFRNSDSAGILTFRSRVAIGTELCCT